MKQTSEIEFISARQLCDRLDLELATVYEMARTGEIPGAVWRETEWGETLYFRLDAVVKWCFRELEEAGLVTSRVDADGRQRYRLTAAGHIWIKAPSGPVWINRKEREPSNRRRDAALSGLHKFWKQRR
jgi:hypothetical protein